MDNDTILRVNSGHAAELAKLQAELQRVYQANSSNAELLRKEQERTKLLEGELTELKRLLFKEMPWTDRCEIIPAYMPRFPMPDTRPSVQIRYNSGSDHPPFLRHSRGPLQGYFWDIYGDDFQSVALATIAISRAPPPRSVDPIKFTIPLKARETGDEHGT